MAEWGSQVIKNRRSFAAVFSSLQVLHHLRKLQVWPQGLYFSHIPPPELGCPLQTRLGGLGHSKHQETSRTFPRRPRECAGILVTTSPQPGSLYQMLSSPADPLSSVCCLTAPPGQQVSTSESNGTSLFFSRPGGPSELMLLVKCVL